tara:strand:- start:647 stop:2083 length:1437 start_codon:yes stop_codon:yes gene_type:complete
MSVTYAKVVVEDSSGHVAQTSAKADILNTARTIGGVSFNGSANINLPGVNSIGNQNTTGNAGSASALATSGAISITGDIGATGVTYTGGSNVVLTTGIQDNKVHASNLQGPSSGALANGTSNQVLTSAGNGTFKWTTQSSANNSTMTLSAGTGISGGGSFTGNQSSASSVSFAFDGSELADGTADVVGSADELIYLDAGVSKRKMINEIKLGQFSNDSGWTSNSGTVTSVGTGKGLTGTVTGSGTLNLDLGNLDTLATFNSGNAMMGDVDMLIGYDDSASKAVQISYNKIDLGFFSNSIGYTLNAIESVNVTAGNGLTGGGSASSGAYSKTLDVGAGTGVTVSSDTVSIGQSVATSASPTFNNMTLSGDLTVSGTTITTNTETLEIGDNKMVLNAGHTGTAVDTGLCVERGSSGNNQFLFWDESASGWAVGNGSSTAFPSASARVQTQKVNSSLNTSDTSVPVGGTQIVGGALYLRTN